MKELLDKFDACDEARVWVGNKTLQEAWDTCHRGDWMLWLYQKMYPENIKELALAKAYCANTVRHLMKNESSIKAIDAAIAFSEGKITKEELQIAASYAVDSYADAAASYAADSYANADVVAAEAAYAMLFSAYTDIYAAKRANQKQTADICRKYLKLC